MVSNSGVRDYERSEIALVNAYYGTDLHASWTFAFRGRKIGRERKLFTAILKPTPLLGFGMLRSRRIL